MTYVEIAGLRTWHEVHETGDGSPPVVLLHGAFGGASSFAAQVPDLSAAGFSLYLPERRGHVHTPDVDGPLTYAVMAEDTIAYLETVLHRPAHLVGWSDGAVVGALVARDRPDLVERLVLIGQYFNSAGKIENSMLAHLFENRDAAISMLRAEYDQTSPDGPDHFGVVFDKTVAMIASEPELDLASFGAITAPTLVLQGDRDEVTVEHGVQVAASVREGRLAVLPGTHALPIESPAVVNALIVQWLRGGPTHLF